MKLNVLVFPCGSEIGLEIHRSLQYSTHFHLIGASSVDDHGSFVYKDYVGNLPRVGDPEFISAVQELIAAREVAFIIPAHDSAVLELARHAHVLGDCRVITSPLETCIIARSKRLTYEALANCVPVPRLYEEPELRTEDFPVFLKPDVGQGSKGIHLATGREDIRFYTQKDPSLLLVEYLPGREFTIDCFTDRHGELRFSQGRERARIYSGISVHAETVMDDRFGELALRINSRLTFRGAWFFQVKERVTGELVLLEIAPRVAGTMGLARCQGLNLVLLSLFDALGLPVSIVQNPGRMILDRSLANRFRHSIVYRHVYIDLDDLILLDEQVNPTVVAFLYQCLNNDIKLHLVSRHRQDLTATLERYRLSQLFDELIPVGPDREKCDFIRHTDAIFIDDSYAEREKVHRVLNIPVFDSHMLESLMESP